MQVAYPSLTIPSRVSRNQRHRDEQRSVRLLFDRELLAGLPAPTARSARAEPAADALLEKRAIGRAVRSRRVPPRPLRLAQQVLYRRGRLDYESAVIAPQLAARRALATEQPLASEQSLATEQSPAAGQSPATEQSLAAGQSLASEQPLSSPPRFLVRVDEFPHALAWDRPEDYGTDGFRRFHAIMAAAGVPYLVAVPSRVSHAPLDPHESRSRALDTGEQALLTELTTAEGVAFALHGRDHRTRFQSPRRRSELCGLDRVATDTLLDQALAELAPLGIAPEVFVPPFNRFDARQYEQLARRFAVVCGGPESIGLLGFQRAPVWRGEAVYLPSYRPLYGRAAEVLPAAHRLIESAPGLWLPIVLHWGWEADSGWHELAQLAELIAPYAADWQDFLAAVQRSGA
jgi:hypothetical protein